jgi:hypothetical protein
MQSKAQPATKLAKVEVANVVALVIVNNDVTCGNYFPEDDWRIVVFGDTFEAAITAAAVHPRILSVVVNMAYAYPLTVFKWIAPTGQQFIVPVNDEMPYLCDMLPVPEVPEINTIAIWEMIKKKPEFIRQYVAATVPASK